ncbi:hypothetical protein [Ornithinimicrobium pratense]|uniref:Uncharacterized protein n=1 Tax=Ornithinimicrobium pratense TaxID=2593973 RepID=A0A5J6V235_9MICO|nr:hypothetical protein [Ornithinimicrobium pratense]QFG67727.1 hypothetical protein FY030_02390 [Ornithinimicrobium pratense]
MSETDRDVLALLDRAAADSPPLHLDRDAVIGRGRQIARRRRAGGTGMAIGALALAGAVWLGPGLGSDLLGTQQISPASVSWEVDEPTRLTVLDGVTRGGNVSPLTVTKGPDGSASATFTVEGVEETVEGRTMAGGVDLFVGGRATVAVWADPEGDQHQVQPWPNSYRGYEIGRAQGDDDLWYLVSDAGYLPEDLLFFSDHDVWTASGTVAETVELTDGRAEAVAFSLSGLDVTGVVHHGSLNVMEADSFGLTGGEEAWWRGGDVYSVTIVRAPDEATHVRPVWLDEEDAVRLVGGRAETVRVGDAAYSTFSHAGEENPLDPASLSPSTFQWSADGHTWHNKGDDGEGIDDPVTTVGPGARILLLGEAYEVAVDAYGWPQLLEADGTVFLTVSDSDGPPGGSGGGGIIMWRQHWWPWSDHHKVHFSYSHGDRDPEPPPVSGQDVVTITGPAGEVSVVAVPAGS